LAPTDLSREAAMIDWNRVTELKAEVGEDGFCEVVDLFLEEMAEVMDRLAAGPDLSTLEADLHFTKGSAMTLGLRQLGTLCQAGERQAAEGRAATVDLQTILACFQASRLALGTGSDAAAPARPAGPGQIRNSASASSSVMSR
jgi:HPt (histidine-containing phosphotransfer) domain-containing protein